MARLGNLVDLQKLLSGSPASVGKSEGGMLGTVVQPHLEGYWFFIALSFHNRSSIERAGSRLLLLVFLLYGSKQVWGKNISLMDEGQ